MGVKFEIENVVAVGSTVENPNIADTAIERQEPYVRSTIEEENATIHTNIVAPARLGGYVNSVNGKTFLYFTDYYISTTKRLKLLNYGNADYRPAGA